MEKTISKFGISKNVRKGNSYFDIKCNYCNHINQIQITNKLNQQKITTFKCKNCNHINQIGDIYNFKTFKRLNNRLDNRFDSVLYDKHQWSQEYDNLNQGEIHK